MKRNIWKLIPALLLALLILGGCAAKDAPPEAESPDASKTLEAPEEPTQEDSETPDDNQEPATGPAAAVTWNSDDLCAVSYLGYAESLGDEELNRNLEAYAQEYDLLADLSSAAMVEVPGYEVYYLVPRDENTTITIYDFFVDGETGEESIGDVLYESTGTPILLLCNFSDLFSNCSITVTAASGETITFAPRISLRDGGLELPDSGVQNVTPDIDFTPAVG